LELLSGGEHHMSQVTGIGVIGMGWMGHVHARAYRQVPDRFPETGLRPRLVVCADDVRARAEDGRSRAGFERSTTDWREVLADPDVQVISVTTPNHLHLEIVQAAAKAGKHVFCEKPVGSSPRETALIAQAALEAGILSWVGFNYRWAPLVQFSKKLIADGTLGRVTHYRGRFLVDYGSDPNGVLSWRFQRELAGSGTLGDLMSHVVDSALMLAGPIRRVVGNRRTLIAERPLTAAGQGTHFSTGSLGPKGPVTNEDYVGALVEFTEGAVGTFEVCRVAKGHGCEMAWEVDGTLGSLKWNYEWMNELTIHLPDGHLAHDGHATIQAGPQHPYFSAFYPGPANSMSYEDLKVIEAFEFLKSVAAGQQGQPGFLDVRRVAEVLAAIERSWSSHRWDDVELIDVS
jgi:predicted dehydrogenase